METYFKNQKKKKTTLTKAKGKAWDNFSIFIRMRGSDDFGMNSCVTCGVRKHWKQLQAGHFVPGRRNAILFDERGVWPQCYHCNVGLKSNPRKYDRWMRENQGQGVIDDLDRLADTEKKYTIEDYLRISDKYNKKA